MNYPGDNHSSKELDPIDQKLKSFFYSNSGGTVKQVVEKVNREKDPAEPSFGDSMIRKRLQALVDIGKLECRRGSGRTPSFYYLAKAEQEKQRQESLVDTSQEFGLEIQHATKEDAHKREPQQTQSLQESQPPGAAAAGSEDRPHGATSEDEVSMLVEIVRTLLDKFSNFEEKLITLEDRLVALETQRSTQPRKISNPKTSQELELLYQQVTKSDKE
jgi:hypothetical protein